jgi:plasmid stabilization system protein ParE
MIGYDFHPEARLDLDDIWESIRCDDLDAADRLITEVFEAVRILAPFPHLGIDARTSLLAHCDLPSFANT